MWEQRLNTSKLPLIEKGFQRGKRVQNFVQAKFKRFAPWHVSLRRFAKQNCLFHFYEQRNAKKTKGLRSMFLHAGNNKNLRLKNIIGIFDMDTATVSHDTKKFLKGREKIGMTEALFEEVPKSFILTNDGKVYFSQISTQALIGRVE